MPVPPAEITTEVAIQALQEVVKGKEGYVYTEFEMSCVYSRDGKPCCLIGHALAYPGFALPRESDGDNNVQINMLRDRYPMTPEAVGILSTAQRCQDSGRPWGEAIAAALAELEAG